MSKLTRKEGKKSGRGKKHQSLREHSSIYEYWRRQDEPSLDMNIQLWHNKCVDQWRWTLVHTLDDQRMESGTAPELREALGDIQRTIEWLMESPQKE